MIWIFLVNIYITVWIACVKFCVSIMYANIVAFLNCIYFILRIELLLQWKCSNFPQMTYCPVRLKAIDQTSNRLMQSQFMVSGRKWKQCSDSLNLHQLFFFFSTQAKLSSPRMNPNIMPSWYCGVLVNDLAFIYNREPF